jgi:hypothetical protein
MLANGRSCARQQTKQRISRVARPSLDAGDVSTETLQRGDAPISIDEHQPFPARRAGTTGTAGNRHDNARNDLAAALDRMGDPRHGARSHQAAAGKAQIQDPLCAAISVTIFVSDGNCDQTSHRPTPLRMVQEAVFAEVRGTAPEVLLSELPSESL